ncbi:type II toxin-antitoxin system VapC family toxin [Bacteroides intestinalis]|jgi:tRNA(fMet)-specific endonuclease VapC|uniref:Type II toxin-antitoxin system VapC family toxin n=1 Tax=Bacteroides intestinalis TaxID=329854 RepID=A0AB37M7D6_9BACE|nr:type II toxin-antitoxin system VapC family toxin [Bacteroides intestinalis]RGK25804.1 type II toxin-antitoxin system VapC family toxin [Bacteroides intestinalis]RHN01993.1 type II toxin-antitoxin system VapC family toxin [Bacteroides intestinalis]
MKTKGYLLDTNICISMLKNQHDVREAILKVKPENCYVSEITLGELYFGASFSNNKEERLKDVAFVVDLFKVIPVSETLPLCGDIKADLRREGKLIDDFDILIGCAAILNHLTIVTDNIKHLGRLPGIIVENWTNRSI